MQEIKFENIIVQPVVKWLSDEKNISISVLRLDLLHPVISGNKWFKLKFYIDEAKRLHKKRIITYGGAWSNHIVATSCACSLNKLNAVGIIRGEEPFEYSDTLKAAKDFGMGLIFLNRKDYQNKILPLIPDEQNDYIIPEGGYGIKGAEGFSTALDYCNKNEFTHFVCAVGTGTMMAGLIKAIEQAQHVVGISVLKNNLDLSPAVNSLLTPKEQLKKFDLMEGYHFGGYAKYNSELLQFMNSFYSESNIPSDFVYTGKLFFALKDLAEKNYFLPGSKILTVHSGGLQGNSSLKKGTLIF
jgi:1-aminocyclopropane-1-carboxylate deaminase